MKKTKLINEIVSVPLNKNHYIHEDGPLLFETKNDSVVLYHTVQSEYHIGVQLGYNITIDESIPKDAKEYQLNNVKHAITNYVYGDVCDELMRWFYESRTQLSCSREAEKKFYDIIGMMRVDLP